jgi:hypothetical protein
VLDVGRGGSHFSWCGGDGGIFSEKKNDHLVKWIQMMSTSLWSLGLFLGGNKSKIQNLLYVGSNDDTLISCFIEGFFEQLSLYIK